MPSPESPVRAIAPLVLGATGMLGFVQIDGHFGVALGYAVIFLEGIVFALVCFLSCAIAPTHPFRVAALGVLGAIVGIIIDLDWHPTVNGYERNLWPLEIAYHTAIAFVCFFVAAVIWRVAFKFFASGQQNA